MADYRRESFHFFTNIPMKKHLFWLILLSLNALIAQAQEINVNVIEPDSFVLFVLPDTPPRPLYTEPVADSLKPDWGHFWMLSDGRFSRKDTFGLTFPEVGRVQVTAKRRGKYSSDDEPPPAQRPMFEESPPIINPRTPLSGSLDAEIILEWDAARSGDAVYAAIVVRNKETYPQQGYAKLLYPTDAFQESITPLYELGEETVSRSNEPSAAVDTFPEGRIQEWELQNIAPLSERVIFVWLQLRGGLSDSVYFLFLDWHLEPLGQANPDNGGDDVSVSVVKSAVAAQSQVQINSDNKREGPAASTMESFNGKHHVALQLNEARDPNGLIVWPQVIRPTEYMPEHQKGEPIDLDFTGRIENMGDVIANRVTMDIRFDARIDKPTFERRYEIKPSCELPCTANTPIQWNPADDSTLIYNFRNIKLRPSAGPDVSDEYIAMRKAEFGFAIKTKPNLIFRHGDKIVTRGTVKMFNQNNDLESLLDTDTLPATVSVRRPGRLPFGLILGVKVYTHLSNADSAKGQGLSLTLRCPLFRPRGNSISSEHLRYMPRFYWQFELGYGQGAFQQPSDNQRFEVKYLHFTPVQLRYLHPVNWTSFLRYIGVSAGYSADLALSGKVGGNSASLPSGFFDRFENELAVSLDVSNRLNVPSVTLGIGYKFRQNNLTGQSVKYSMPFVYAQLDIIRFRRRFAQVWNTVHRW